MKFSTFEKYIFINSEINAVKTFINFSHQNNIEIVLHEETQNKYKQIENKNIAKEFPPLLFSIEISRQQIGSLSSLDEINRLTLLDGHHRFEHLTLYKYDLQIPIVIISNDDVNIESYNSEINVDLEKFEYILKENNFTISYTSKYFLTFQGKQFSSEGIDNIYDLYDFKRSLIGDGTITPIQNDLDQTNIPILDFTPVKLNEFNKENYLFPPKSTWITPRI